MNKRLKAISVITAIVMTLGSCLALSGCTFLRGLFGEVEFTRSQLTLEVGETFDLSSIVSASSNNYSLSSSSPSVASVSGKTLAANAEGTARVTAKLGTYTSTLAVTVTEREDDALSLDYEGELVQTSGATSTVVFTARPRGTLRSKLMTWYVNGVEKAEQVPEYPYSVKFDEVGAYEVKAVCGEFSASYTVRVYYETEASGEIAGELTQQSAPYEPVTLTVNLERNHDNPADYIEWFVDGELVYGGTDTERSYTPAVGQHTVTLRVNGVARNIGDKSYATLYCVGSVVPRIEGFLYDNLYPHAYLVSDAVGKVQVEITMPNGTVNEYSQSLNPELFDDNGFDAGGAVNVAARDGMRQTYKFRVKSLGDGGAFKESEYSEYYAFTQVPSDAGTYLKMRYADKDRYITSELEYVNLLEYEILFRSKTASSPKVSFDCYLAYPHDGRDYASELFENAFEIAATSGSYEGIRTSVRNNIMHTEFTVSTVNNPSRQTKTAFNSDEYVTPLHAVIPHINYDRDKDRPIDYVFPIDLRENTVSVSYTDELYFAAENNSRPMSAAGSSAQIVYDKAREILRQIVTDDMTDVEKAHAIYDWIMWQVTYDTPASETEKGGESYSAYYLEGVFGDGTTSIAGVKYEPYAVCDGMSKAYSLMCNIEGIPCVRVTGVAGSSLSDAGGHAWNKVFVNNAWYIVDCTWGDAYGELSLDIFRTKSYEMGLHDYLFRTDGELADTHFEPFDSGDSTLVYVPRTPKEPLNIYTSMNYNGINIDCLIKPYEVRRDRVKQICTDFASSYQKRSTIYIPGGTNDGVYKVGYEGIEIHFADGVSTEGMKEVAMSAVRTVNRGFDVNAYTLDNSMIVLIKL